MTESIAQQLWGETCKVIKEREQERIRKEREYSDRLNKAVENKISLILNQAKRLAQQGKDQWECSYYTRLHSTVSQIGEDEDFEANVYEIVREKLREESYDFKVTYSGEPCKGEEEVRRHTLIVSWKPSAKK